MTIRTKSMIWRVRVATAAASLALAATSASAADLFWYGTAGDGLWNNPANWSTTESSYTAASVYPNNDSLYIANLYTTTSTWEYDEVASKTEADWTPWDGTTAVAGLAVKIVGANAPTIVLLR